MKPLFKEYLQFIDSFGYINPEGIKLTEGMFWHTGNIIKGIDKKNGNIINISRIYVDDKLNITYKHYKIKKNIKFENWKETIKRNEARLLIIEQKSLMLIRRKLKEYGNRVPKVLISGGKDSALTQYLAHLINPDIGITFGNTSLDVADTYKYIKQITNVTTINPKEGFYQWRNRLEYIPTRFNRACCDIFKEGEMVSYYSKNSKKLFFMGMRNSESGNRSGYGDMWKNHKWGDREWDAVLPIREYTEEEVWLYTLKKNISINDKYKKGYSRVGCGIACPYYTKFTWILDRYWYPTQFNRWREILKKDFIDNQKWTRTNGTLEEYMFYWNGGQIRKEPNEETIKEMSKHKGITKEVCKKFFSNKCSHEGCKKNVIDNNLVAMNMKLLGRNTTKMLCKKHLKKMFDISENQYKEYIEDFKKQGCELF